VIIKAVIINSNALFTYAVFELIITAFMITQTTIVNSKTLLGKYSARINYCCLEFFSSPPRPNRFLGTPSLLSNGSLSLGVKQPGREADHSSPCSAEVKE
jgi:hypothetical protein